MKIYQNISEFESSAPTVVTTGTFDGVHIGHRKIITRLNEIAKSINGESVILTFAPHPRKVLNPDTSIKMLSTQDEKIELLRLLDVDHLIIHPFTKEFARTSSTHFVRDIIVNQLQTQKLVIGYDHHFGRNREGSFEHLVEFGPTYGFDVEEISALDVDQINVSSTKIRKALLTGDIETSKTYLGHDYGLTGTVVHGKQIGRSMGFPTANIRIDESDKLIPSNGVYAVRVSIDGVLHNGMLNIGTRPTIDESNTEPNIEVHVLDFDGELYDKTIRITFVSHMRSEIRFGSIDDLKQQLEKDRLACLERLSSPY